MWTKIAIYGSISRICFVSEYSMETNKSNYSIGKSIFYLPNIFGTIHRREKRIPPVTRGLWGSTTSLLGSTVSREQQLRSFRLEPHGIFSEHTLLHVFYAVGIIVHRFRICG